MAAEETSSSSHLSPGTEHPTVHAAKDHHVAVSVLLITSWYSIQPHINRKLFLNLQNFLTKRPNWPESQEPEVTPTAGAAVAYQQVNLVSIIETDINFIFQVSFFIYDHV